MRRLKYVGSMSSAVLYDGREVKREEPFEADDQTAEGLLAQTENYAPADDDAPPARPKAGRS